LISVIPHRLTAGIKVQNHHVLHTWDACARVRSFRSQGTSDGGVLS